MTRDDVIRITEEVLKGLSLELKHGHFTDPNSRTIVLKYNGTKITSVNFNISQRSEYEG